MLITGGVSLPRRDAAVRTFQEDPECKVLIATPKSGGVGLNLVAGNYVFHFDHWWNPATDRQAEDRVHRIGQTRDVFVYHFWAADTIEERIYRILERKRELYSNVIDALSNVSNTGVSEKELFALFDLEPPGSKNEGVGKAEEARSASGLARLIALTAEDFELKIGEWYETLGFRADVTQPSRDGGVDVIATRAQHGGLEKYAIQCKKYRLGHKVGVEDARALLGVVHRDRSFTKGVLVTTSEFTSDCRTFCMGQGNLELIDGAHLLHFLRKCGLA